MVGILAALAQREKTGKGAYVDTALVDSTVGVLSNQALNYLVSGKVPKRIGNAHANIVPYQVFPVADGHVIVATGNDNQYVKFCNVLGAPELAQNPAYKDNIGRLKHREELIGKLSALTARMQRDDLLDKLEAQGVPAGPINDLEQVFNDPQVIHRGMKLDAAERRRQGRHHTGRAHADRDRRLEGGLRTPLAAARRAHGGDSERDRGRLEILRRSSPDRVRELTRHAATSQYGQISRPERPPPGIRPRR